MDDQILEPKDFADLPPDIYSPAPETPWFRKFKFILPAGLVLLLLIGAGLYFAWSKNGTFTPSSSKVGLSVLGPTTVASATEAQFVIKYHNGEDADLTQVHLDLIYPSNFQFKSSTPTSKTASGQSFDLPVLKEGKDGELTIRGKFSGSTGEDKQIQAKLRYKLSNFNSTFESEASYNIKISAPKLTMDITGPAEVPIGQDSSFTVTYTNVSGQDYDNLAVTMIYPEGFKYTQASLPPAKGNNYWQVGKLANGATGHIDISGSFIGQSLDEQLMTGMLGQVIGGNFAAQIISTSTFRLKNAPLSLDQSANPVDIVNLGDSIQYTIYYENESTVGLTNLVITDTFVSSLVDTSKISASDAVITGSTITWKAATNHNLALLSPSGKGQVQLTLPLKQTMPATVKNQIIKNSVTISSAEITTPIRSQDLELKLATKLKMDVVGDFVSGAAPMEVGKPSTFAMTLLLSNQSNDLTATEVTASLPLPSSAWTNSIVPESEKSFLSFDPNSGIIRWDVGSIPAFAGKLTPARKVTFNLTVTPGESDRGQIVKLLSDIQAMATDSFTNQTLKPQGLDQFTTSDINDDGFQSIGSTVQ
jgi:uncharacterized repeat protein (TIGR01451 family)